MRGSSPSPSPVAPTPTASPAPLTTHVTASVNSSLEEVWIVGYARTPIGGGPVGGVFAGLTAPALGAIAIREAVKRAGIKPEQVEEVIMVR
jgi:hypothetical protein